MTFPELPDFLLVPKDYKPETPARRLKWTNAMSFTKAKKNEDPATRKLRREIEKAEAEKKQLQAEERKERARELRERRKGVQRRNLGAGKRSSGSR